MATRGAVNAVLLLVLTGALLVTIIPASIGSFALAVYLIPKVPPSVLMYIWDGLILTFLLFWGIGLLTDLQKSDALSLSKFLHLPVTVQGAFLINYLSSLLRLSLLFFGPVMLAFALALVYVKGLPFLPTLPALLAFFLMITALTYQFQGWLGALMTNPRRRRTVIVLTTVGFILFFQIPNLMNLYMSRGISQRLNTADAFAAEVAKLDAAFNAKEFDSKEFVRRRRELTEKRDAERARNFRNELERWERAIVVVNTVLPIGWLPVSVRAAANGAILPSLLGFLGMTFIGTASLWSAYRTTLAQYLGRSTSRKRRPATVRAPSDRKSSDQFMEKRLPGFSEPVSAIALGTFRSLVRAPEAKMALLSPIILGIVAGLMLYRGRNRYHGIAPNADGHRRLCLRPSRFPSAHGQSIRHRSRWIPRLRALRSAPPRHLTRQKHGSRSAGVRALRGLPARRGNHGPAPA